VVVVVAVIVVVVVVSYDFLLLEYVFQMDTVFLTESNKISYEV
jgi:hypothetical protein